VRHEHASVASREVTDDELRARARPGDACGRAFDPCDEAWEPVVVVVVAKPFVAFAFAWELGGVRQDAAMRHADGTANLRCERRRRARAAERDERDRKESEPMQQGHDEVVPESASDAETLVDGQSSKQ
jgi:hypothetical protein